MRPAGLGLAALASRRRWRKAVISTGSRILTLPDEALVWLDLEGALGVGVSMASDLGVLGEVCEAMVVISEKGTKLRKRSGEGL